MLLIFTETEEKRYTKLNEFNVNLGITEVLVQAYPNLNFQYTCLASPV